MLTELQTKKWTRLFQVYDADGNGTVTQEDFELIFQNLAKFRNLEANTPQYDQLHAKFMEDWEHLQKDADKDKDGKVQLQEWLEHGDRRIHDQSMYQTVVDLANQVFELLDLDGNGVITAKEYKTIMQSWHVSEDVAAETFPKLDLNGDGNISKEELVELVRQFHASDDPQAPGNSFFGPY
ncbi:EF-hand domain-containing protein [Coleofasciculus sp. E1-EBD-02]|uniref:EF-hand domain-containing protein n=1 Tax=Coleofasciculus sp. E1-EBD-02 TaxID=3068481 RepID=UPI0033020D9A